MAEMTAKAINDLPDSAFAYIESGGSKDSEGKTVPRSKRHFPIHDADHVRNALARIAQGAQFGKEAMPKVKAAAKKFGIEVSDASRSRSAEDETWSDVGQVVTRSMPIDDLQMRPGKVTCDTCGRDATGRIVDQYMVPFDSEAEIRDEQGHYYESYDPTAFNRRLEHLSRSRSGLFEVGVFYNHGMSLYHTPVGEFSIPIGHPSAIRADGHGVLTSTHYGSDEFADRILTGVKDGNIAGQSFTGKILRSDPQRIPRRGRDGSLPRVRRLEMGLSEYGPTPVPYFTDTPVVALRSTGPTAGGEPAPTDSSRELTQADIARRIRLARELGKLD